MVKIEKNSFYRRAVIPDSGAVVTSPRFKDLTIQRSPSITDTAQSVTLEGGMNPLRLLVSGNVPSSPAYGAGELKGGYLRTFVSGISLSGTNALPVAEVYKVEEGIGPTQGNYNFALRDLASTANDVIRGDKLFVMSSFMDGDTNWLEENFDGSDKSLGQVAILGDQGTATLSFKDAYLDATTGVNLLYQGGDNFGFGSNDEQAKANLRTYFSSATDRDNIYIRPVKRNRTKGLWTATNDRREGRSTWNVYAPFWKWEEIKGHIRFKSETPATDDIDSSKDATENNTIFSHIAVQGGHGNVYTAGEEAPLLQSTLELSTSKKVSGGQSLRFYHLWEFCPDFTIVNSVEATLGKRKVNPQCTKASIYNIPEPPPALDMGAFNYNFNTEGTTVGTTPASGGTAVSDVTNMYPGLLEGGHLTDKRLTFPEINITMNIAKLFPSPQIEVSSSQAGDIWGDQGWVYGYPSTLQAGPAVNDFYCWSSAKIARAAGYGANGVFSNAKGGLNTLLRSVAITFSNYKPEGYHTLDEFLAASLDDTYIIQGNASGAQLNWDDNKAWAQSIVPTASGAGCKVASGIIFQTFRGTSEYNLGLASETAAEYDQDINPDYIYAAALPMCRYNEFEGWEHTNGSDKGLYASGGFVKFDNAGLTYGESCTNEGGAMTLAWDPRIGLTDLVAVSGSGSPSANQLPPFDTGGTAGRPWGDSGSVDEPLWVAIPKDSWFNLKFVFDSMSNAGISKGVPAVTGGQQAYAAAQTSGFGMGLVSGGTYSYSVGDDVIKGDNESSDGSIKDYNLQDPSIQFGVPLRCYISGAVKQPSQTITEQGDNQQVPYLNIPLPMRRSALVSTDSGSNWYRGNNTQFGNSMQGIQNATWSPIGDTFPYKYMTIWVNNYRHTSYQETGTTGVAVDYPFWRGNYFNDTVPVNPQGTDVEATNPGSYRAADSKLYPSGLSSETEVYIDNITFKYWNNEHINHSMESGKLSRFIKIEQSEVLSPVTTFFNTGNLYNDDTTKNWNDEGTGIIAAGGTNVMTAMMKGFNHSGNFRAVKPGRFISIGVDDPYDLPLEFQETGSAYGHTSLGDSVANITNGDTDILMRGAYFLFNNFTIGGNFSDLQKLIPDIAIVSADPPAKPIAGATITKTTDVATTGNKILTMTSTSDLEQGMTVSGNDAGSIVPNTPVTTIVSIDSATQVTINQNATSTASSQTVKFVFDPAQPRAQFGTVNYACGFNANMGSSLAGSNMALYNPIVSGADNPEKPIGDSGVGDAGNMRTKQSPNIPENFVLNYGQNYGALGEGSQGWVIDNHQKVHANPTQEFPSVYSNSAGWAGSPSSSGGSGYVYSPLQAGFNDNDDAGEILVDVFPGFNWLKVTGGTTQTSTYVSGSGGAVNMGTGSTADWLSTDGFTQKGFTNIAVDTVTNTGSATMVYSPASEPSGQSWTKWSKWAPRENILCSAKITGLMGSIDMENREVIEGNSLISVDDTSIFNVNGDDRYVIFQIAQNIDSWEMLPNYTSFTPSMGWSGAAAETTNTGNSSSALGYHAMVKLSNIKNPIQGNTVSLTVTNSGSSTPRPDGILRADDVTTPLCIDGNIHNLWISPLKYWISLGFFDDGAMDIARSYESVCAINEIPRDGTDKFSQGGVFATGTFTGSTFNESLYFYDTSAKGTKGEAALKANPWNLDVDKKGETNLDLQDYGYGDYEEDKGTGGQVGIKSILRNKLNYIDIDGIVKTDRGSVDAPNTPVVLTLGLSDEVTNTKVTVYSDLYTGGTAGALDRLLYKPAFIWRYHDKLPEISKFKSSPSFDALKEKVNLYDTTNQDFNSVNFTWNEATDGDIWYRMLMVDTVPITNKYHKAKLWLPLNEVPDESNVTTAPTRYWYSDNTSTLGLTSGTTASGSEVLQTIEGLAGYAPVLLSSSTTDNGVIIVTNGTSANQNEAFEDLTEFTFVLHSIADSGSLGSVNKYLLSQDSGSTSRINVWIDTNRKVNFQFNTNTMVGTTLIPDDGETPFSIIGTYKSGSAAAEAGPDLQLFVNGKREDYVVTNAGNPSVAENANLIIGGFKDIDAGAGSPTNIYTGIIEEFIIYEKRYDIAPSDNKYIFNAAALADVDSSDIAISHNAKIFLFDYHNIRGKERQEVCESNSAVWRTTA